MAQAPAIFNVRTVRWIVGIAAVAFMAALFLSIYTEDMTGGQEAGPNPYSDSAIGHRAFVTFLKELDVPVVISRNQSLLDRVGGGVTVLLEPPSETDLEDMLWNFIGSGPVLLVLPKWRGMTDLENPRWVREVLLINADHVADVLNMVVADGQVIRPGEAVDWSSSVFSAVPAATVPQLITGPDITPLVEAPEGILLGVYESWAGEVYILSDPDILNNHGLGEAENALFVAELIDFLRGGDGGVVIDATLHGFTRSTNMWRSLFELPFLPVTLLGVALVLMVFWAGSVRFGAPRPAPRTMPPGKQGLIGNTARLLDFGGNFQVILKDYLTSSARRVAAGLHAPKGLDEVDLGPWFDRIAESRGIDQRFAHVQAEINALVSMPNTDMRRLFAAAQDIHRWKKEMLRGSRTD